MFDLRSVTSIVGLARHIAPQNDAVPWKDATLRGPQNFENQLSKVLMAHQPNMKPTHICTVNYEIC